jgi:hypothetical protein
VNDDLAPTARLDGLFAAVRIAYEAIYNLHGELGRRGLLEALAEGLLAESAAITVTEVPKLTTEVRRLVRSWREQSVLDPGGAERTLHQLETELQRVEPGIRRLIDRQREIARELRSLGEEPG